jgi:hypothetical protein
MANRHDELTRTNIEEKAECLVNILSEVAKSGPIECLITGGRDTRVLVSMLINGRLEESSLESYV